MMEIKDPYENVKFVKGFLFGLALFGSIISILTVIGMRMNDDEFAKRNPIADIVGSIKTDPSSGKITDFGKEAKILSKGEIVKAALVSVLDMQFVCTIDQAGDVGAKAFSDFYYAWLTDVRIEAEDKYKVLSFCEKAITRLYAPTISGLATP